MEVNSIQALVSSECKPQPKVSAQVSSASNYAEKGAQLLNVGPANVLGMAFTGKSRHVSPQVLSRKINKIYEEDIQKMDEFDNNTMRPVYAKVAKVIKEGQPFVETHPRSKLTESLEGLKLFQEDLKYCITRNAYSDYYNYFDKDCREFDKTLGTYEDVEYYYFSEEKLQDLHNKTSVILKDLSIDPKRFQTEIKTMKNEKKDLETYLEIKSMSNEKLHDALAKDFENDKLYGEYFNVRGLDISEFII